MPIKAVAVPASLRTIEHEGFKLVTPLQREVEGLTITDAASYLAADALLGRVVAARKRWAAEMDPILTPAKVTVSEAKKTLAGAQALAAKVDGPLGDLELRMKAEMRDYKIEEIRQIEEQDRVREQEKLRLQEQERKAREVSEAPTASPLKARLAAARATTAVEQIEELEQEDTPAPVKAEMSTTRRTPSWRITDTTAFVQQWLQEQMVGSMPSDAVIINTAAISRVFRATPELLDSWPGIERYDEISVVRK